MHVWVFFGRSGFLLSMLDKLITLVLHSDQMRFECQGFTCKVYFGPMSRGVKECCAPLHIWCAVCYVVFHTSGAAYFYILSIYHEYAASKAVDPRVGK